MAEVKSITLNRMKMITWRWLKMNERTVEFGGNQRLFGR